MPRRREEDEDFVDLGAPEHEWWAKNPTDPFAPVEPEEPDDAEAAEAPEEEPTAGDVEDSGDTTPSDETDPYAVLRLTPAASWEEIVANYRRLARWWHPDGLGAAAEWGRAACEHKIRQLNAAYGELRIRRGR